MTGLVHDRIYHGWNVHRMFTGPNQTLLLSLLPIHFTYSQAGITGNINKHIKWIKSCSFLCRRPKLLSNNTHTQAHIQTRHAFIIQAWQIHTCTSVSAKSHIATYTIFLFEHTRHPCEWRWRLFHNIHSTEMRKTGKPKIMYIEQQPWEPALTLRTWQVKALYRCLPYFLYKCVVYPITMCETKIKITARINSWRFLHTNVQL